MPREVHLHDTFGIALIGYLFSCILYASTCCQMVVYFKRVSRHNLSMNITITVIWIFDTLQLIFMSHALYYYLILSHGDYDRLKGPNWSIIAQLIPSSCTIGLVQYIWIMRLWTLNRSRWRTAVAYCMLACLISDFVISLLWAQKSFGIQSFWAIKHQTAVVAAAIGLNTLIDSVTTVYFTYLLHQYRDGLQATDSLVNKLTIYCVNTGLLTCFGSVSLLLTIIILPLKFYYLAIYIILEKTYVNCLLAMINWTSTSRRSTTRRMTAREDSGPQLTSVALATMSRFTQFEYTGIHP